MTKQRSPRTRSAVTNGTRSFLEPGAGNTEA
ncbi:hypothetical protein HPGCJGGD_3423 [Methylobacterium haplocladii]|nr:hypothetical protein HPGCJGGD_3423 [Methylobacterium haplocladii]